MIEVNCRGNLDFLGDLQISFYQRSGKDLHSPVHVQAASDETSSLRKQHVHGEVGCAARPCPAGPEQGLAPGSPGFRFHLSGCKTRKLLFH